MEKVDVAIIGAGIVGLSVAAEISQHKKNVYVLERHESFGKETSSRNSEVIHTGIYYPKDSLKAKTCIEGNRLIYQTCIKNNIPHRKIGKLIVATETAEISVLEALFENAKSNGVEEIELLTNKKIKQLEPNINATAAFYSKTTGIVDSHRLMKYYAFKAQQNGVCMTYNTEVIDIKSTGNGYEVAVTDNNGDKFKFLTEILINCAGLESDTIAAMVGIDIDRRDYRLKYCKGQYFKVSDRKGKLISRLIYPVPDNNACLGIHATPNLAGAVRLGPDDEYIRKEDINYDINEDAKYKFYESTIKFLPFLKIEDLSADTSGIRPKLQGANEAFRDFIIKEESDLGFPGFMNLIGIESPGLTAAPSIAKLALLQLKK